MSEHDTQSSECSEDEDLGEDNESTMAEDELLNASEDVDEELRLLSEEGELSVEELRRRYYGATDPEPALPSDLSDEPCSSALPSTFVAANPLKQYFDEDGFEDESDDEEYIPKAGEYWKKEIRIGDNYQVSNLPEAKKSFENYRPTVASQQLWKPKRIEGEPQKLRSFLEKFNIIMHNRRSDLNGIDEALPQSNRVPKSGAFADNEDALFALMKHEYNAEEALKHLPFSPANGPQITAPNVWNPMTSDDFETFESAFREHGKNFYLIRKHDMPDRSVGELVTYYYTWKKTERHDMFVESNRALGIPDGSSKTIDPMDVLVDQQLEETNGAAISTAAAMIAGPPNHPHKAWLSVQQNSSNQPKPPPQQ